MGYMTPEDWAEYQKVMNEWQEDAFQQEIIWKRNYTQDSKTGEGNNIRYMPISLRCLVQYNYFRSWPVNQTEDSGEIDKNSIVIYLNIEYLRNLGYVNKDNQFTFNPGYDRFILNGLEYTASGDTHVAQAYDKPLFMFIVLKREEIKTSETKYPEDQPQPQDLYVEEFYWYGGYIEESDNGYLEN
ncbi:MAG: hypothetical protein CL596_05360 [Alteromonas sp.]|mgnify:CR=1 FL=1|nr:hypothetical protein [Alteromonas sp.]|tara:strand:+ start:1764 stop:2318 length:555 start_codon:yes stop_codon:yes gene_type:complete